MPLLPTWTAVRRKSIGVLLGAAWIAATSAEACRAQPAGAGAEGKSLFREALQDEISYDASCGAKTAGQSLLERLEELDLTTFDDSARRKLRLLSCH
jgi:hypothetical protein